MILILTYAKVCTTSLHHLLTERFPGDVFRSHGLEPWILDPLERFAAAVTADTSGLRGSFDNGPIRERLAHARATGETITIISGVRDPVSRSLSVAMQNLEAAFADCVSPSVQASAEAIATRVADLWLRETTNGDPVRTFLEKMIRAPFEWFEQELAGPFGFDLREQAFDTAQGYSIQSRDNVRLLLFRHERAPAAIEKGLTELFPGMDFVLPHDNTGEDKPSGGIYRALRQCFRLPRATLEAIYAHADVRPYFGDDEITAAIERWAEPAPQSAWVMPPPPAAPRQTFAATVFIPLRNHAPWIGAQIDSLLAQWRPDVELVLVDDGSQDGSLAAALDRLGGRPEVMATVMRNSTALGHGMLPAVLGLSRAPVIIQADSDDIALPGRLDTIIGHFAADPDCRLVTSNAVLLSETGISIGVLDPHAADARLDDPVALPDLRHNSYWLGASSAFHRSVIEAFPPLDPELCAYGLDLLTGFRAILLGSQHFLAQPLVGWRQHARNSHRVIGALDATPAGKEHLAAILFMTRAQRLRDLAWLQAQGHVAPERAARIDARWRADHSAQADEWIRLRNRLTGTHAAPNPLDSRASEGAAHVPAVPPILTLTRGFEWSAAQMDPALSRWSGTYGGDSRMLWISRQTAITLRIPEADAEALVLTLAGIPYVDRQSVFLSLDFAPPMEITLVAGESRRVTVPIVQRRDPAGGLMTLMIRAPEAVRPCNLDPANPDQRMLGVALFAMQVI